VVLAPGTSTPTGEFCLDRIGLTFDAYVDVVLRPSAGAAPAFHEAAEMERDEMFPLATPAASTHLRSRAFIHDRSCE
jgi:hypothetical protein